MVSMRHHLRKGTLPRVRYYDSFSLHRKSLHSQPLTARLAAPRHSFPVGIEAVFAKIVWDDSVRPKGNSDAYLVGITFEILE